ncbi:hypothetical protein JOY44_13010 [Phormidium sp. CLA17]|uniref:hypothetical protein n=1 Tax=Leptolyngbya sp. Cla-17 TaxID=2803751 RepID=UPI001492FC72|nr:hypothetical protein [Leptolyngbya sp. Cla-17]MBM0742525.1 hypothetical protein [Leptolyngbya sp. Cla-17]
MMRFNSSVKSAAITGGISILAGGIAFAYWSFGNHPTCLRMVSGGTLESVYSTGCVHPQRYRRWTRTAQRES